MWYTSPGLSSLLAFTTRSSPALRYSAGLLPKAALNARLNASGDANPLSSAISITLRPERSSCPEAWYSLRRWM